MNRFWKKQGQVFQVDEIELVRTDHLNSDYAFQPCHCPVRPRPNDQFLLFSFVPKLHGLPRFEGRLDENRKFGRKVEIDIDLCDAPEEHIKAFRSKKEKVRYRGHHTHQAGTESWTFELDIAVPVARFPRLRDGHIFRGAVRLSRLLREIDLPPAESKSSASMEIQVIRAPNSK